MTQNDPKKGLSGQLDLTMVVEVVIHDGFGVAFLVLITDLGEFGLEDLIGHSAGILEFAQAFVGESMQVAIRNCGFEGTPSAISNLVLLTGEPTEEIILAVVRQIVDEMVCNSGIKVAVFVFVVRPFTVERNTHQNMASPVSVTAQFRNSVSVRIVFVAHARREVFLDFIATLIEPATYFSIGP